MSIREHKKVGSEKGGRARADKLSKQKKSEIAKKLPKHAGREKHIGAHIFMLIL